MDSHRKPRNNYDRVMSRVYNRSRPSLKTVSNVTREVSSSGRVGAKPSLSAVSSSVFSELPTVLNNYVPDVDRNKVGKRVLVKPRRTLMSLDPGKAKSPQRASSTRALEYGRNIRARGSAPVLSSNGEQWAESHVRQCYSSRSHTRLKELKDEIKAFHETDKLMKLRSHLYSRCGVVMDDMERALQDQSVQASPEPDKENTSLSASSTLKFSRTQLYRQPAGTEQLLHSGNAGPLPDRRLVFFHRPTRLFHSTLPIIINCSSMYLSFFSIIFLLIFIEVISTCDSNAIYKNFKD